MPDNNINVQNNYLTYQYIVDIFKTLQENTISEFFMWTNGGY